MSYDDGGAPYPPTDGNEPCRTDPEAFFPEGTKAPTKAKGLCAGCSVRQECLDYALTHAVSGVWGGTTLSERRAIQRTLSIDVVPLSGLSNYELIIRAMARGLPPRDAARLLGLNEHSIYTAMSQHRREQAEEIVS